MQVTISVKKGGGFEGTVSLPGVRPTKLVKKSDGKTSVFATVSAVRSSARGFAQSLGLPPTAINWKENVPKAAKKRVKTN